MSMNDSYKAFLSGKISKETYISNQYENYHSKLFELSSYIKKTNIKKIEIVDDRVIFTTRSNGLRFICPEFDLRSSAIETLNFLDYEKDDSNMILNLINDGDTIFDIGANMGWYSILFNALFRSSEIHSFEPVPNTYSIFIQNIELNNSINIIHNNFGLSNDDKNQDIYFYPQGSGNASLQNLSNSRDTIKIICKFKTLNQYVNDNNCNLDFLKCDVEGAELLVFKGGIETIKKFKPIVFSEILRKWSKGFGYDPNDIFDLFRSIGYEVFCCRDGKLSEFGIMDDKTIESNFFFLDPAKHLEKIKKYT